MRSLLVAAALIIAAPAFAADAPQPSPPAKKRTVAAQAHYPTLEKMLRRFSRQAGEARTRG